MATNPVPAKSNDAVPNLEYVEAFEKLPAQEEHLESVDARDNLVYDNDDKEPELHARTYIAIAAMVFLNYASVIGLNGPPAVLTYIGKSLNSPASQTWVVNAPSLVQAVVGPVAAFASDTFQARKVLLIASCVVALIGCAIAPGSGNINRLIAAQSLIGVGWSSTPILYCIPSEILPRRWRPLAQASVNVSAVLAAISGPLIMGSFVRADPERGWRKFYWIQLAVWGAAGLGILIGYKPPKRHTRVEELSLWRKLSSIDLPGAFLLMSGLALFLAGLGLGGGPSGWTGARTLTTLIVGGVVSITFGIYEWKGTKTGILHHDLFQGRAGRDFGLYVGLIFIEGILLFSFIVFYPVMSTLLFEQDPFLQAARSMPFWVATGISTVLWGFCSTRLRRIRELLSAGYLVFMAGIIGLATIEPSQSVNQLIFAALTGCGFGAPLILVVSGVQLCSPHKLIATSTAVLVSARSVGTTTFTAIFAAALQTRLAINIPNKVIPAAAAAGLPASSIPAFVGALANNNQTALAVVPGVTPAIIGAGVTALRQGFADSIRVVFIIAAPFGLVACLACSGLSDTRKTMNYHVDAPVEELHAKDSKAAQTA